MTAADPCTGPLPVYFCASSLDRRTTWQEPRGVGQKKRYQTLSDGYSASEPLDDSDQQRHDQTEIQAWEDVGLEHADDMKRNKQIPIKVGRSHHIVQMMT